MASPTTLDDITMVSATITLSLHLACEAHGLFPIPPSRPVRPMVSSLSPPRPGLGDPWSLTYPPTLPGRPMVSSLSSPPPSKVGP